MPDCENCDYAYRSSFVNIVRGVRPGSASLYDLDLVLEVDGEIKAIFEYKRFQSRYTAYHIPAFEYIALKKFGKLLKVTPYVIIETLQGGQCFHIFKLDRFEFNRSFATAKTGRKMAVFDSSEGVELYEEGLKDFITKLAQGGL